MANGSSKIGKKVVDYSASHHIKQDLQNLSIHSEYGGNNAPQKRGTHHWKVYMWCSQSYWYY